MLLTIVPSFLELLLSCSGTFDYSVAPMGCIPPGSSVHGILQTRILEWVFPSPEDLPNPGIKSRYPTLQVDSLPSEPPGKLSRVQLFATPRTVAYQAPLSMGFSRQESWSGLPFPSPDHSLETFKLLMFTTARVYPFKNLPLFLGIYPVL